MRLGFVFEQILGHVTHSQNLKCVVAADADVQPTYVDLPFQGGLGIFGKLPVVRTKWAVRASLIAYRSLRKQGGSLQAALFHTHATTLFSAGLMERLPSVISLDAPPFNRHETYYRQTDSPRTIAMRDRTYRRVFASAKTMVVWSNWVREELMTHYGIPSEKIIIVPPGIDTSYWHFPARPAAANKPVNVLFVGADFDRKGGNTLLQAFLTLPASVQASLHLVTKKELKDLPSNVIVYNDISPNSQKLVNLFAEADIFAMPTRSDCLPLAILEALSSGLPVITTDVGALSEVVEHGKNGLVVPPSDDPTALNEALTHLISDAGLRQKLSCAARETACAKYDAPVNYGRLLQIMKSLGEN